MLVEVTGGAQVLFFVPGLAQAQPQTPVCVCVHHLCPAAPAAALGGDGGFLLELQGSHLFPGRLRGEGEQQEQAGLCSGWF